MSDLTKIKNRTKLTEPAIYGHSTSRFIDLDQLLLLNLLALNSLCAIEQTHTYSQTLWKSVTQNEVFCWQHSRQVFFVCVCLFNYSLQRVLQIDMNGKKKKNVFPVNWLLDPLSWEADWTGIYECRASYTNRNRMNLKNHRTDPLCHVINMHVSCMFLICGRDSWSSPWPF